MKSIYAGAIFLFSLALVGAADLTGLAQEYDRQLREKILPYWYDTTLDRAHGGYLLADDLSGRREAKDKALVVQARMVWGFSHAHLYQYSDARRDYLQAAQVGYRFLRDRMLDAQHGGYYWRVDAAGKPLQDRKIMYGQSFVIYALVEYYRATQHPEAIRLAMDLFFLLQRKAHDLEHGGWIEHFTRDWRPVLQHDDQVFVEVGGYKSANTHLHLMEAFTELYAVTGDATVRRALQEALEINRRYFYPLEPGQSCFHRQLDWRPVTDPKSAGLSYGHNVEFAWLMVQAQKALGQRPDWRHFYAHIDHALQYGYDWERGGLYHRGVGNEPASDTTKVWWAEAELIAALSEALAHQPNPRYAQALEKQFRFLQQYQTSPEDGIWLDTVYADGKVKSGGKAHHWKANYHDVRAIVKFIQAFKRPASRAAVQ
ncbi:AGE family epimerase/isomerase [Fontisphaera persica]|uniref:AGE family epimerase/isomerase n=1 Tax=Fontisphaera persica TaxID=2974023 RepID=UPI0024C06B5F|nr:AGE family epimerase/isomerase [Fontisphaera persica]WCJ61117.1 AGE family epimerase/isomerase [Fontisphaera persica]